MIFSALQRHDHIFAVAEYIVFLFAWRDIEMEIDKKIDDNGVAVYNGITQFFAAEMNIGQRELIEQDGLRKG